MALEKIPLSMVDGTLLAIDQAARYDVMLLAFRNQMLSGRVFDGMVQGMSDAFEDESGVNVSVAIGPGHSAGSEGTAGYTIFDRTFVLTEGFRIDAIRLYSGTAGTIAVKVGLENDASDIVVVVTETFSHGGSGWETFTLSSSYTVPAGGTYRLGVYTQNSHTNSSADVAIAYVSGDATGSTESYTSANSKSVLIEAVQNGESIGVSYDATEHSYSNPIVLGSADVTGSGTPISSSDYTEAKDHAFDDNTGTGWRSGEVPGEVGVSFIGYDFGASVPVGRIRFNQGEWSQAGSTNYMTTSVKVQYSDDGAVWEDAGTFAISQTENVYQNLDVRAGAHRYWRVLMNAAIASHWSVREIEMLTYAEPPEMTLASVSRAADTAPSAAQIAIWEEDVDTVTLNTDIKAYVSSDDGATWDEVLLSEKTNLNAGRLLGGTVDLTVGDTEMRWKITTHNDKALKIHAAGMLWG